MGPLSALTDRTLMSAAYLEKLNHEQRRAVEHGVLTNAPVPVAPLLVIAGAGSGKTNTLAHRVAHLIVNGIDPRRILLMTFSRRAAAEMGRRVASDDRDKQFRSARSRKKRRGTHDRLVVGCRVVAFRRQPNEKGIDARHIAEPDLQVEHPAGVGVVVPPPRRAGP